MEPLNQQVSGIASADMKVPGERVAALDGMRGFAVLWVMLYHFLHGATHNYWLFHGVFAFIRYGYWGVDVFFVLSGFLITGILYDSRLAGNYFSAFYARRVLRIFPLYYSVLIAVFLILPAFHEFTPQQAAMAREQGWLWFYLGNIAMVVRNAPVFDAGSIKLLHFWSLAIEEQFYLVWPAVVLIFSRKALMRICAALVVAAAISRLAVADLGIAQPMASFFTLSRVDGLALGALVALWARGTMGTEQMHHAARQIAIVFLALLAIILLAMSRHWAGTLPGYLLDPVHLILFAAVLVMAVAAPVGGWVRSAFSTRWLVFFGKYSYALYVFHYMMLPLFHRIVPMECMTRLCHSFVVGVAVRVVVCTTLSLIVSLLSWHLLEKHFLALKKYFVPAPRRQPVPAAEPVEDEDVRIAGASTGGGAAIYLDE